MALLSAVNKFFTLDEIPCAISPSRIGWATWGVGGRRTMRRTLLFAHWSGSGPCMLYSRAMIPTVLWEPYGQLMTTRTARTQ